MKTSFIIVNYNGKKTIKKCLDSILNQNFPKKKIEVIVVDNNSKDVSWKLVKKYKRVRLIRNKKNYGFVRGNNIGIRASSGKFIVLINNDVTLEKNWLKKMVVKIKQDKKIGVIGCKILYPNSNEIWFGGGRIYFPGFAKHLDLREETYVDYVAFASVILKKEILKKTRSNNEYLDENLFMYGEDAELCKRLRREGFKILYCPHIIAYHHIKENRISSNEEYYMQRNRAYYYTKFYGFIGKIIYLIGDILLFFPAFVLYRIIKNPRRIKFWKKILKARIDSIKLILKWPTNKGPGFNERGSDVPLDVKHSRFRPQEQQNQQ